MRKFKMWQDPYGDGFSICSKKQITINPGITVLVGCNGAGKSTLIHNLYEELEDKEIPFIHYNNLKDGGNHAVSSSLYNQDYSLLSSLTSSSEGESLHLNIGQVIGRSRQFIRDGKKFSISGMDFSSLLGHRDKEIESNERWFLFDAVDSGLSIDQVIELKEIMQIMVEDGANQGKEVYIIVSANEYELADNMPCFDVNEGKYIKFDNYQEYKDFILESREKKDKRYEELAERLEEDDDEEDKFHRGRKKW